jgi:hypothetical protein
MLQHTSYGVSRMKQTKDLLRRLGILKAASCERLLTTYTHEATAMKTQFEGGNRL